MGTTYAMDLIPVDDRGRSAPWSWRAAIATEPPEVFVGFGATVLAPAMGTIVLVHDGEEDHDARRSQNTLLLYMLGQAERVRRGPHAIAGNHVVIAMGQGGGGPFVLVAHLRRGSLDVTVGDRVAVGQPLGQCGNSGNSTQPHVHVQATDSTDWNRARGLPIAFMTAAGVELPSESQIIVATAP